ncbi:MAG: 30S ribosome-binding factor RbfA [Coriobacteriia bacterium]|nr:30S ribosome-binding factor RbfA [Coriobacteriia bacterium]
MSQNNSQSRRNNEAVRTALADILTYEISDPRLQTLTISGVSVSSDRSVARVYVLADRVADEKAMAGLESAKGRIRSLLGAKLKWRATPELRFYLDTMMDDASRIEAVLRDAPASPDTEALDDTPLPDDSAQDAPSPLDE